MIKKYILAKKLQALQRGKLTRRKLKTSMARRRTALSRLGYTHGVSDDIIEMINHMSIPSRFDMTRPSHIDMIDETPYNMRGSGKRKTKKKNKKGGKNPCWKNYKMVGMKNKNDKRVPNCVYKKR
jgi:hypothetical protein